MDCLHCRVEKMEGIIDDLLKENKKLHDEIHLLTLDKLHERSKGEEHLALLISALEKVESSKVEVVIKNSTIDDVVIKNQMEENDSV